MYIYIQFCRLLSLFSAMINILSPAMVEGPKNVTQLHELLQSATTYHPTFPPFPPQRIIIRAFLREKWRAMFGIQQHW